MHFLKAVEKSLK